jgi:hypothetical protein
VQKLVNTVSPTHIGLDIEGKSVVSWGGTAEGLGCAVINSATTSRLSKLNGKW